MKEHSRIQQQLHCHNWFKKKKTPLFDYESISRLICVEINSFFANFFLLAETCVICG